MEPSDTNISVEIKCLACRDTECVKTLVAVVSPAGEFQNFIIAVEVFLNDLLAIELKNLAIELKNIVIESLYLICKFLIFTSKRINLAYVVTDLLL